MAEAWRSFKKDGHWDVDVNVRNFIQTNYTPYDGDESFLEGPTEATDKLWGRLQELQKEEREHDGVLECETEVVSSLTAYGPGYIDESMKDLEQIVGLQTDKPLKRAFMPYGGIKMAQQAASTYGYEVNAKYDKIFNEYHKTHNQAVFDNNGTETKWNFDTDTVKCTMTLKAKWELSTYSVTLQTDGGTIASGKEVTGYTYGTGAVLPTTNDITRKGYRFDGWYADSNFSGSPVTEITGTDTGNKTFYAKWTRNTIPIISGNTINYIVEHYKTDGSGYTLAETEHSAGKTGDTVAATPKTYEGFTYNPAISTASGTLKKISSPEDIVTLKLYYDVNADTEQESTDSGSEEKADREGPSPVVKNTPSYVTYTVQAGDTLWKIARKYSCSVAGIVAANSDRIKNPNRIHAGWQLKIPMSGAPVSGSTPDAVLPENKKSGIYIVRQGDTLWAIARKCSCSVAEIISLNWELIRNPALIYSGWELKVPQD
jgi:uncharacterized repeat protein (TIGR02543 family)